MRLLARPTAEEVTKNTYDLPGVARPARTWTTSPGRGPPCGDTEHGPCPSGPPEVGSLWRVGGKKFKRTSTRIVFFPIRFFLLEVLLINSVLLEVICLSMECAVHCGTLADCANCW